MVKCIGKINLILMVFKDTCVKVRTNRTFPNCCFTQSKTMKDRKNLNGNGLTGLCPPIYPKWWSPYQLGKLSTGYLCWRILTLSYPLQQFPNISRDLLLIKECFVGRYFQTFRSKGSDWIRLVFAHPFPLNSRAPIASANFQMARFKYLHI